MTPGPCLTSQSTSFIIIIIISFMQGIYTDTPETSHVSEALSVSAVP
jgi:hypothetical protein